MTHVDWYPYPEEKPEATFDDKSYLVTASYRDENFIAIVQWLNGCWDFGLDVKVHAWAELPDPYQPEVKNEIHG